MTDFEKTESGVLKYSFNFEGWLHYNEAIVASRWNLPDDLTLTDHYFSDTDTTVVISGGTLDKRYRVFNIIETSEGEIETFSFHIRITITGSGGVCCNVCR